MRNKIKNVLIGGTLLLAVAFFDFVSGPELSTSIFYLIPIIYIGWSVGKNSGFIVSGLAAILWFFSDILSGQEYSHPVIPYWNALVRLGLFLIVSIFFIRLQHELKRQKEINEQLERANQEVLRLANIKSEFTAIVSHELRTPLTAIKESLGIIQDRSAGPLTADQDDFLSTAMRNLDRLTRLINDVLDLQKLEAGRMEFRLTPGSINEMVQEIGRSFSPVANRKGLELKLSLEDGLPSLELDKDRIAQVLTNLINNAVTYSARGSITVKTQSQGDEVRVSVEDQGRGIRETDKGKLFQSFSQLDSPEKRETGGTGLGLAISKKIIEGLGGEIGVISELGKGSTFFFTLKVKNGK